MAGGVPAFFSVAGDDARDAEGAGFPLSLIGKFELVLAEWHLTPEYLLDNWTDEQFDYFFDARNKRILETSRALKPKQETAPTQADTRVSDTELFALMRKSTLLPHEFDKFHA